MKNKILEPSLLAFSNNYINELKHLKTLGISQIHFDIMDGEYVPNVSIFDHTAVPHIRELGLDVTVHLMGFHYMEEAKKYIDQGIKSMTFQYETIKMRPELENDLKNTILYLKEKGIRSGIAFNPSTSFEEVKDWIDISNIVTLMSVTAGKGGQAFCKEALINLKDLKQYKDANNKDLIIQIDGGVNLDNLDWYLNDVDYIVSGSSFYKADDNTKMLMINKVKDA